MPAARPSKLPLYLAAAVVVAGVVLGGAYWFTVRPDGTPATASTPPPPKRAAEPPSRIEPKAATRAAPLPGEAIPAEPATIEPVAIEPTATEAVSTETAPAADLAQIEDNVALAQSIALGELPTVEDPIAKLLALGRGNLAGRRLTSPPGDNAVERFELVLRIEPRNAEAKAGLLAVAQAYYDLAAKIDRESALPQWLDQIARGEAIAKKHQGAAALAAAAALRQGYVDELLRRGAQAIAQWQREQAIALHQRALQVIPDAAAAQQGLRRAELVGRPGYVFKDDGAMPEMIVAGRYALARREVSVGEFRAYWRDAGQRKFAAATPSCRDRERFLTSSRKRTWQAPDYTQTDRHPVVCVNYAMAEDYARWLAARSGKRYRMPNAAEWRAAGATDVPATCAANVRDAAFRQSYGGREGTPCSDGHAAAAPTASFAARKSGLYDADGNVREWVSDCAAGCKERLALGASWNSEAGETPAPAYAADTGFNTIGFRVLRELD